MAFPTSPANGQEYKDYIYDSILQAWKINKKDEQWAIKEGPLSHVSEYVIRWNEGYQEGDSFDALSNTDGITILKDGLYEIRATLRIAAGQTVAYVSIAANGHRDNLINKNNVLWNHDDARSDYSYTESNFLGRLSAGDFITAGSQNSYSTTPYYGTNGYSGTLSIKRLD